MTPQERQAPVQRRLVGSPNHGKNCQGSSPNSELAHEASNAICTCQQLAMKIRTGVSQSMNWCRKTSELRKLLEREDVSDLTLSETRPCLREKKPRSTTQDARFISMIEPLVVERKHLEDAGNIDNMVHKTNALIQCTNKWSGCARI